ncbi:PHB depolymerase family esterase [Streptomyces justiciae]|uniref:PHB depolymerase family esterase n=1 Tax=Streptomyces justiciae TaxID=2780140 RepID=A0ABU3M7N8_9ACTN|nr:PHB depolymerase family esterase [Streptomyces justiciae]MDT7847536.1 PHB depolymerase family esterase [Streptomyces justiciae]
MKRRSMLAGITAVTAAPLVTGCSSDDSAKADATAAVAASVAHITGATAITEVFADGQKLTTVALKYDKEIDRSSVSLSAFRVKDRTVTNVYTNTTAAKAGHGANGAYVIIELSPHDAAARVYTDAFTGSSSSATGDSSAGASSTRPSGPPSGPASGEPKGGGMSSGATLKTATAQVTQVATVKTTDGDSYAASSTAVRTSKVVNLIVDDFQQGLKYTDSATGSSLTYNLYIPEDYDKTKSYPLVLFMHDAGTTSTNPLITLTHGLGAVVWADPLWQQENPCFVLAPQFTGQTDEGSDGNATALKTIKGLIDSVTSKYSVDKTRLYTTGQSGGAMTSIALDFTYPDLFAASFLVAGQWEDLEAVKPLARQKIWAVVSQGDETAYPGMTGIMDTITKEGTQVSRAVWNGQLTPSEFALLTAEMRAKNTPVNFVALKKGTVVWPGLEESSVDNHICTWRAAYTITGIREWIFEQKK